MTEKAEKSGKDLYIGIDVNIHSIINKNGKFYLIGEVYHETYETVTSTYNGVKTTTTRFAGFQFTHGMVLAFNEETELVWNYVFEMELKDKRMDWEKNVSVIGIDQRITFAFLNEGYISLHFVSFDGANIEMKKYYNRITTMSSQLQYATHGEITPWCDHSFLTSGYSKIKDSQQRIGKRNQRYYYVNKINF